MRSLILLTFASSLYLFNNHSVVAQTSTQTVVRREVRRVASEPMVINENTKLLDNQTGKPISYQTYQALMNVDRAGYKLVPVINEYGVNDAYIVRPTTTEERETGRFLDRNSESKPKVGEAMPEFVMKGIDDKEYRLSALKGRVVVLSFWMGIQPPYWNARQATMFSDALRPYQTENGPIVLGVLRESKDEVINTTTSQTLPFVAIPNAYNFSRKFHINTWPCIFVIDKAGNVAAYLDRQNTFEQLPEALKKASQ